MKEIQEAKLILWVVFALLFVLSIILLSGKGQNLIAGYNTASEKEKERYDGKKLSRVVGVGLSFISLLVLLMALFFIHLPSFSYYIFLILVLASAIVIIILANTICRK